VYELAGYGIRFSDIVKVLGYLKNLRKTNPTELLVKVEEGAKCLYLSDCAVEKYEGYRLLWVKLGYARKTGAVKQN